MNAKPDKSAIADYMDEVADELLRKVANLRSCARMLRKEVTASSRQPQQTEPIIWGTCNHCHHLLSAHNSDGCQAAPCACEEPFPFTADAKCVCGHLIHHHTHTGCEDCDCATSFDTVFEMEGQT